MVFMQPTGCMSGERTTGMDEIFKALADPNRRRLLDSLNSRNGQSLRELCVGLAMARQSVSKHLAVLEAANLVTTTWRGREKLHYLNAAPVHEIAHRWISRYDRARVQALADPKLALEETPMDAPTFVYTTYIRTTPQKLWQALTEPAFTRRYWATAFSTDWAVGSPMTWDNHGVLISDPEQVVLEAEPYTRLSYTWHAITPELAKRFDWDEELTDRLAREARSKVTFTIEETAQIVKLTVVHDGFELGSALAEMVSHGWPNVVASLKTLLETGEPLPADA
jgi:uncharacterized protein YndB with AHSA1/START domain/DNA-binding transcriptional ArsR family regulator